MANLDLGVIRARHVREGRFASAATDWCLICAQKQPCDAFRLLAELDLAKHMLRAVEWCATATITVPGTDGETRDEPACPCCRHAQRFGHYQGCTLAVVLRVEVR